MTQRYFVDSSIDASNVELAGAEAHHLIHVMRAKEGDEVVLFDGGGDEFAARVERVGRAAVQLAIVQRRVVDRESPRDVTLAVALPKGERQRWLVEKATELGVRRLMPLVTQRSVAQPASSAIARLQRAVVEASKQCGRNRLMEIAAPLTWRELIESSAAAEATRLVAHPDGNALDNEITLASEQFVLAIGPEGGFTDDEVAGATNAGWQAVSLGPRILRIETAAIYLASVLV